MKSNCPDTVLLKILAILLFCFSTLLPFSLAADERKLSASSDGLYVELKGDFHSDRQIWRFEPIKGDWPHFHIYVKGGTSGGFGGDQILSVTQDGRTVNLYKNAGIKQTWKIVPVPDRPTHFHIMIKGGVDNQKKYLSTHHLYDNKAYLARHDDGSGHQHWKIDLIDSKSHYFTIRSGQKPKTDLSRFEFHQGMDSPGFDIKRYNSNDPEKIATECLRHKDCIGFNTNGWIKRNLRPRHNWSRWTSDKKRGFYVKKDKYLEKFTFYPYDDSWGNDIKTMFGRSSYDMAKECVRLPNCRAFNTGGWLKHRVQNFDSRRWTKNWKRNAHEGVYIREFAENSSTKY